MKKILLSASLLLIFSKASGCADYYPDGDYFNLFTQTIIKDKTYIPFLFTYGPQFYDDGVKRMIPDENIFSWQKYFGNRLDYRETEFLVNHMSIDVLNSYKNGNNADAILKKLGSYQSNAEAIDYLIEAKYLEPYMKINYVESEDSFYVRDEQSKDASQLNFQKTVSALVSLYGAAKNPEIKQRYGYQIVRFYHYNRNYEQAVDAFKTFVEPVKLRSVPYYYALDQMAGAQRGLKMNEDANWNFFRVFMNAPSRKEGAFVSMKLSDSASFQNILKRTSTPEEKNMAYFLLGYSDFTNPIPNMQKMFEIDPDSEILKVMAARAINVLERNYLANYLYSENEIQKISTQLGEPAKVQKKEKLSFWDRVVNFFRNLFGSKKDSTEKKPRKENASEKDLTENPNRIPVFHNQERFYGDNPEANYLDEFSAFTAKTKEKSIDEFWQIADAYVKFLQKDFEKSSEILAAIKTTNPEYTEQINRMKMLNDITAQPRIDTAFENHISQTYPDIFSEKETAKHSLQNDYYYYEQPTTADFIRDVLANRYFLQNEDGKSFLMHNKISDLQYYPDPVLAKKVQDFVNKPNKTALEQTVIMKNADIEDSDAFFNIIYGDAEMRKGNFVNAKTFYAKATDFQGIPRTDYDYNTTPVTENQVVYSSGIYDGFNNISSLVFGHNVWESFSSSEEQSVKAESFAGEFPFIKNHMNKLELADALVQLQKTNNANANQLIGNVLYNTSSLGYFRELFIMDIDNSPWGKNDIDRQEIPKFQYYYKQFSWNPTVAPDNFDTAIGFYEKALKQTQDKEQQTRILFQLASAEQGKYYQWKAKQSFSISYDDPKWEEKQNAFSAQLAAEKNRNYRKYFTMMKKEYAATATSQELMGSCSYYSYFINRN